MGAGGLGCWGMSPGERSGESLMHAFSISSSDVKDFSRGGGGLSYTVCDHEILYSYSHPLVPFYASPGVLL